MSELAERLKSEALLLAPDERAEVASFILQSLGDSSDQAQIDAAWKEELQRRWQEIEEGKVQGIPAKEVIARLRGKTS